MYLSRGRTLRLGASCPTTKMHSVSRNKAGAIGWPTNVNDDDFVRRGCWIKEARVTPTETDAFGHAISTLDSAGLRHVPGTITARPISVRQ